MSTPSEQGVRIARLMARAGLCSRREAEQWVLAGRVTLDGVVLDTPAIRVAPSSNVTVDGKRIEQVPAPRLWRYHKPPRLLTSHRDPQGRPCLFDRLPIELGRTISVGRLDYTSEGLLLLTNDGAMARWLELPSTGWLRRYRVRVRGAVDAGKLAELANGVEIDGQRYGPIEVKVAEATNSRLDAIWLNVSLREGRNREVKRVLGSLGYEVARLIRLSYGPFRLGSLVRGAVEEIPRGVLRAQLGQFWKDLRRDGDAFGGVRDW